MLRILFTLFCGLLMSTMLLSQTPSNSKTPIKYRLLMTSVSVEDLSSDEIAISLNAFNTGRTPIDFSQFSDAPNEMEIKFEESFYRGSLSAFEEDIIQSLINRNIIIKNGKILRDLKLNLPSSPELYKQLTKKDKRFTKNYVAKDRTKAPKVKYKTADKKNSKPSRFAKKNKKNSKSEKVVTADKEVTKSVPSMNDKAVVSSKPNVDTKKEMSTPKVSVPKKKEIEIVNTDVKETKPSVPAKKVETSKVIPSKNKIPVKEMPTETEIAQTSTNKEAIVSAPKKAVLSKKKEKQQEIDKAKKESYQIEQATQKDDKKKILESLGVDSEKPSKKNEKQVAFDTRAGVEESKNSYSQKSVCPDLIIENVKIIKKNSKWVTLEYTLSNIGKGPVDFTDSKGKQNVALRAFLSSSERLSKGSLPLGGGFVAFVGGKGKELYPDDSYTRTLKLDIRKMTRFTPFIILNFDPFNAINECDKTNNYSNINVGK